ncbi:class I SAM-dependent methyltransferase [Solibacillus sp. MA9]|uniref:Class I SAM-dependent methyltransferase n=1 Tax=Solibacillus palustris TaxID=2908203 RepID=A0ABS9UDB7_9BACL|nr:class I SAM-dependent methyltransferase [Solibacillus sp. MA9]MCH7321968.1 class I SAM-dependent methyltransferase [Solibacillus sp. MA9]
MKYIDKFTGKAQHYNQGRPSYAPELIDDLYKNGYLTPHSIVADIGAGTGKFTEQILQMGNTVFAVEPNNDMRAVLTERFQYFDTLIILNGTDEATSLADHSVDAITVAQAFHWFDIEKFKQECTRILKPNGLVILIWNMRDEASPVNQETYRIFQKYCSNFTGFSGGIKRNDEQISAFFDGDFFVKSFSNHLYYSKDDFIARSLSASYSLKQGDELFEDYLQELTNLYNQFVVNGVLEVPNNSVAYIGKL